VPSPQALFALARAGFGQRRKTLRQALRPLLGGRVEDVLAEAGIPPILRAEALTLDQWAALARAAGVSGVPEQRGMLHRNAEDRPDGAPGGAAP